MQARIQTRLDAQVAAALRTGYGKYRYKRGHIMGVSAGGEELCVRFTLNAKGFVSFAHVPASGPSTLIDMPVTDWSKDGVMTMACGASLSYKHTDAKLVIDGITLYKHGKV